MGASLFSSFNNSSKTLVFQKQILWTVQGIEIHHSEASRQPCSCCKSGGRWEEKGEPRGKSVTVVWLIIMPALVVA